MPATNGTKARTTAVKRARNTLVTPYLLINASLRPMNCGYRFSGQLRRISWWYRCPSQNDKPSPAMAPPVAATSRSQGGHINRCRKSTDTNNERGAGNHGADHRDGFRQRQQEDRSECIVRMRPDKVDELGKIRRHRFVLTRPTSSPILAAPVSGTVINKAAQLGRSGPLAPPLPPPASPPPSLALNSDQARSDGRVASV